jgi:hypothetical protein
MKVDVRRGLLLAEWLAQKAGNGLIIDRRQQCIKWFAVRQGAGLQFQMWRRVDHMAQWNLHQALQRVMRVMLCRSGCGRWRRRRTGGRSAAHRH